MKVSRNKAAKITTRLQVVSLLQEGKKKDAIQVFLDEKGSIDRLKEVDLSAVRMLLEKDLAAV